MFLFFALRMVEKAKGRTGQDLSKVFVTSANLSVWVLRDGAEVEIKLKDVAVGDLLILEGGEIVPVDGTILEGSGAIDQRMLTGESQPSEKVAGDAVYAATMMLSGRIKVRVEKAGKETVSAQIDATLNQMTAYTDDMELRGIAIADRLALPYLALGGIAAAVRGLKSGLAVLWFPLDDTLWTAGPLGVLNYLDIALERGILIKDGRVLEVLPKVDTIVFDKTGTLTQEQPEVAGLHVCGDWTEDEVLRFAAITEQRQIHPIAAAIMAEARRLGLETHGTDEATYALGLGIKVLVNGQRIVVGSDRFMDNESIAIPESLTAARAAAFEHGASLVYVAIDDALIGAIELRPIPRPGTGEVIRKLKNLGLEVIIISGDNERPTRSIAERLGVTRYYSDTLPEDKSKIVAALQAEGKRVCFVGDGINDAIALKQAEVSVSLRGASTIATDTAKVIITNERLDQLIDLFELSGALEGNFKRSLLAGLIPTIAIIGGVFFVNLSLTAAITLYLGGMSAGVSNAMLPRVTEALRGASRRHTQEMDFLKARLARKGGIYPDTEGGHRS